MVLLDLIRQVLPPRELNCHSYPLPVIYHRHPYFPAKHEFADEVIRSWALEIYDFPPLACGVKCRVKDESHAARLELVTRYQVGTGAIDLPMNTEPPIERRPFVCGLQWLVRPKTLGAQWPWTTVFIGHKSSDVDPYEGPVPLKDDQVQTAGVTAVFPLRHWTDEDVWDYIEQNAVPYDMRRYRVKDAGASHAAGGRWEENPDKWLNPDYVHACTACIDPRETRKTVPCPKLGGALVRNMGPTVVRMEILPDYIEKSDPASHKATQGEKKEGLPSEAPCSAKPATQGEEESAKEGTQNAIHS
jgi:hypothetical protein